MKQYYNFMDRFMVRIPYKSNDIDVNYFYNEQKLNELCHNNIFLEQILISSKSLYDSIISYRETSQAMSEKKKRNIIDSLMKYDIRIKTRTTPFGLCSAVGLGYFKKDNNFRFDYESIYKKVRVDSEWLFKLIKKIELIEKDKLAYKLNGAVFEKGNRFSLLYSADQDVEEVCIRKTELFDIVHKTCKDYVSIDILNYHIMLRYPDIDKNRISTYMEELIRKEFLISDLRPSLTTDGQFDYLIKKIEEKQVDPILLEQLNKINQMCQEYCVLPIGKGEKKLLSIINEMANIQKSKFYLQVDSGIEDKSINLEYKYAQQMNEVASLLINLSNSALEAYTYMDAYREKFINMYGKYREVPILEMLDRSNGIGAPHSYTQPRNNFYDKMSHENLFGKNLQDYLLLQYVNAVMNNCDIDIEEDDIKKVCGEVKLEELPNSLDLHFILKEQNSVIKLYLSPTIGATSAGKTLGRFTYLSHDMEGLVKEISEKERFICGDNVTVCDLNMLPPNSRSANVTQNHCFGEKELSFYTGSLKEKEHTLNLKDIVIGINDNYFFAKNKKTGELLSFKNGSMYNRTLLPNALRFLLEISYEGKRKWKELPWERIYDGYKYIPRIKYKNVILSNKKWYINNSNLNLGSKFTYHQFLNAFEEFCIKYNVPDNIYLSQSKNRLNLWRKSQHGLLILYQEFKKNGEQNICLEEVEEGNDVIHDLSGKAYVSEIAVILLKINKEKDRNIPVSRTTLLCEQNRYKLPFQEWIYLRLFVNQELENEIIALRLFPYLENLKMKYDFSYFFLRHGYPKHHIRLRLKADMNILIEVYSQLLEWFKDMKERNLMSDVIITMYQREIERYGGVDLINYAENVFFADSFVVASILRLCGKGQLKFNIEEIGIISVFAYLEQFELTYQEQIQFLESNYYDAEFKSEFNKYKARFFEISDFENNWSYLKSTKEGCLLLEALELRRYAVLEYKNQIKAIRSEDLYSMIASVIHLNCNRLLGSDKNIERKIMSFCERTIRAKKYVFVKG